MAGVLYFITVLPIAVGIVLHLQKPGFWSRLTRYYKWNEYGEPKSRPGSAVITNWNSWTSLSYWYAGVYGIWHVLSAVDTPPTNCGDVEPVWLMAISCTLLWTGAASFLFHASLTDLWRALDAGATMGVAMLPLGFAMYRYTLLNWGLSGEAFFVLALAGWLGCHILSLTPGWSDPVLIGSLTMHMLLEWGPLRAFKTPSSFNHWAAYAVLMLSGVAVRAADVKRSSLPSALSGVAWCGHSLWHILTSIAIALLIKAGTELEEPFCRERSAVTTLNEAGAVKELRRGLAAGDWTWLPVYPLGHAQIQGHLPFSVDNVLLVLSLFALLEVVKVAVFAVLDACLANKNNKKKKGKKKGELNSRRFKTVVYFTAFHVLSAIYNLRYAPDPSLAFLQPALPSHLRVYYLVQIAYTVQSFKNIEKTANVMSAHHLITFSVLLSSWRFGFVRIGEYLRHSSFAARFLLLASLVADRAAGPLAPRQHRRVHRRDSDRFRRGLRRCDVPRGGWRGSGVAVAANLRIFIQRSLAHPSK